jgi:hypothetical protein
MQSTKVLASIVLGILAILMLASSSCFGNASGASSSGDASTPIKPKPSIASVVATTSGTQSAYYAILDIKAKNDGAEGTILVVATVTQAGVSNQREMEVYLMKGETHELKLTFPLVWKGGDFTPNVQAIVP